MGLSEIPRRTAHKGACVVGLFDDEDLELDALLDAVKKYPSCVVDLNEGEVQAIFNRCGKIGDDGTIAWDEETLKKNRANIRYLLGQLALVHEGVKEHELDSAFFKKYNGQSWTDLRNFLIRLLNMGGKSEFCSFFKKDDKQFVELKLNELKPTLSPKDEAFAAWYEKNGAEFEAEDAYVAGKIAYEKGDYEKAIPLFEKAVEKGHEEAAYALRRHKQMEEAKVAASRGDAQAQFQLATFYEVPDAAMWLDKAAAQGHKGAVIAKKLFQNGTLTAEERNYVRDNYENMPSSVRDAYDAYMVKLIRGL